MSEVDCVAVFEGAPSDHTRVSHIDENAPNFLCEVRRVSPLCEHPVEDTETLVRFVVDPIHLYEEDGKTRLQSSFFNDASTVGASTLRKERATAEEYEAALDELITQNPKTSSGAAKRLYGVVLIPVLTAKSIVHRIETKQNGQTKVETPRAFGVYATGIAKRPHHSDLMVNRRSSIAKAKANKAGENLTNAVQGKLLTVEQFKEVVDLTKWAVAA